MRKLFVVIFISLSSALYGQIHNRMIKFNVGISQEQFGLKESIVSFNDTSTNHFDKGFFSPVFSISEEFTFNEKFSLGATLGYQYFDIKYNSMPYGFNLFFGTINPQLSVFYRAGFEYYIKLKAGMVFRTVNNTLISEQTQRQFPQKTNLITGVTIAGLNFFVSDNWALNAEFSIWSPEWVNIGISYRFFKGVMPNVEDDGYFLD